jgi:hypothetical protein
MATSADQVAAWETGNDKGTFGGAESGIHDARRLRYQHHLVAKSDDAECHPRIVFERRFGMKRNGTILDLIIAGGQQ